MNSMFDDEEVFLDDLNDYDTDNLNEKSQLSLLAKLIILLLVLAMLTTLVWPLLRVWPQRYYPTPTPTPGFLLEA